MKTIHFTKSEVEFLREKYQEEIQRAENYLVNLRQMLRKLDTEEKTQEIPATKIHKKRGRKPKQKPVSAAPKKRGRPAKSVPEPAPIPAYSIDRSAPKKKKKKNNRRNNTFKSSGGNLNLAPLNKQKKIKDLILEKFPEMISKIK